MYEGLRHLHNANRWLILLFAVLTIFSMLRGFGAGAVLTKGAKRNALILLILCDTQLLIGLYQYFAGDFGFNSTKVPDWMQKPGPRFWGLEHISGMVSAIALVHVGYAGLKKALPDARRMKRMFWCTLVALLLILVTIPWPGSGEGRERPLMPGGKMAAANVESVSR